MLRCCSILCVLSQFHGIPLSPHSTVLCSDRVGQVTKTYHDIKAVTHLLEEVRGRHTADEWDYNGLKLAASLTIAVCHTLCHAFGHTSLCAIRRQSIKFG